MPLQTIAWPVLWILSAIAKPWSSDTPGITRASAFATPSKVLWLSFSTITRQAPPSPPSGPPTRGSSMVPASPLTLPNVANHGRPDWTSMDWANDPAEHIVGRADLQADLRPDRLHDRGRTARRRRRAAEQQDARGEPPREPQHGRARVRAAARPRLHRVAPP